MKHDATSANQRLWAGMWLGLTLAILSVAWPVGSLIVKVILLPNVHAPYPEAILLTHSTQAHWLDSWRIIRQYEASGPYRDVVEWYQGKDSLLPLPGTLPPGCFAQSFRHKLVLLHPMLWSQVEEQVTVCAVDERTTIISVTTIHPPKISP